MRKGWLTVARLAGVPVRVHWSVLLGALLLGWFRWVPGLWLGYLAVLLAHELGHAAVVRAAGLQPISVDVYAVGGVCHWRGRPTPVQRACVAWGGVWAQLAVLAAALVWAGLRGEPASPFGRDLMRALVGSNLWLMAANLLPVPGLDGGEAWALFRHWPRRRATSRAARVAPRATRGPAGGIASVARQLRADLPMLERPTRVEIRPSREEALRRELESLASLDAADLPIDPAVDALLDRITADATEPRARTGRKG